MLTPKEDMEITSLSKRGWSIAAIARHTGRDRKTVRAHLNGEREGGVRQSAEDDPFDRVETYVRQRLADDPHVWATVLFDEAVGLGYDRAYPTFTQGPRARTSTTLRAVPVLDRSSDRRDRTPAGRGDPGGLARTHRHAVGPEGVCTRRSVVLLVALSGLVLGV